MEIVNSFLTMTSTIFVYLAGSMYKDTKQKEKKAKLNHVTPKKWVT